MKRIRRIRIQISYYLWTIWEFFGGRGNDGLTKKERKEMADEYWRKVSRPLSFDELRRLREFTDSRPAKRGRTTDVS